VNVVNRMVLAKLIAADCLYAFSAGIADVECNEVHPFIRPQLAACSFRVAEPFSLETATS
jgi:hypothetical protein